MNLIPIRSLNIYGAVIATIISYSVVLNIKFYYILLKIKYAPKYKRCNNKPIFASILMIGISFYIYIHKL
ncbi:MAG: polysaccharide biosynthesis C-terminal domain-containing protein [Clostridium sp.]